MEKQSRVQAVSAGLLMSLSLSVSCWFGRRIINDPYQLSSWLGFGMFFLLIIPCVAWFLWPKSRGTIGFPVQMMALLVGIIILAVGLLDWNFPKRIQRSLEGRKTAVRILRYTGIAFLFAGLAVAVYSLWRACWYHFPWEAWQIAVVIVSILVAPIILYLIPPVSAVETTSSKGGD